MHRRITGKLVIATHNPGKLAEMRELLAPYGVEAVSAGELGLGEPDETGDTFRANAAIKAMAAAQAAQAAGLRRRFRTRGRCARRRARHFLGALGRTDKGFHRRDDADRAPAAGARRHHAAQRNAHFVSALCVAWPDGHLEEVEARADGTLVWPPRGTAGFGYDPVFLPDGHTRTFGEMTSLEKHGLPPLGLGLSHRARAFVKLAEICLDWHADEAKSLRRLRALAVLPVEMPVLRFQQPCPARADRRRALCPRLCPRDRNHRGAHAGPRGLLDLSRRRHAVADAAANRRRHSRCHRQSTGASRPMPKCRWKPIRPASRRRAFAAIAPPASTGFRSACRRSTMPR